MLNLQETAEVISLSKIQTVQQEESGFAECNSCFLSIAHTVVMLVDSFLAYLHIVSSFHFFLHFLLLLLCSLLPPYSKHTKKLLTAMHIFTIQCYLCSAMKNTLRQIFYNSCAVRTWQLNKVWPCKLQRPHQNLTPIIHYNRRGDTLSSVSWSSAGRSSSPLWNTSEIWLLAQPEAALRLLHIAKSCKYHL